MAARLKVYRTPAGFEDALVAAPSQKAALEAWGASSNLFAMGEAEVVDDPALAAEALARPGEVIRRPRGDAAAFLAAAPRPKAAAESTASRPGKAAKRSRSAPAPDRSQLDAAETALARAEDEFEARRQALQAERDALEARMAAADTEAKRRLGVLRSARDKAQAAFDAAST